MARNPKALKSTATSKDGVFTGDLGAVYKSKNTFIGVEFDPNSNIAVTLSLKGIKPLTNTTTSFIFHDTKSSKIATTLTFEDSAHSTRAIASLHLPNFDTSKFHVQYVHHHATLTTTMALSQTPTIDVSTTIGTQMFSMGANANYETSSSKLTNLSIGINVNVRHSTTSLVMGDKCDTIKASYIQHFDVFKKTAVAMEITKWLSENKTSVLVGVRYAIDNRTTMKVKVNDCGMISGFFHRKIIRKSFIRLSTELDTKALYQTPKFGVYLVLKH